MKLKDYPDALKTYVFHGLELNWSKKEKEAEAECPFCGKDKFYINAKDGRYHCKICGASGNHWSFLRELLEISLEATTEKEYYSIMEEKGITDLFLVKSWSLAKNIISGEWILPAFNSERKVTNLYRYANFNGSYRFISTPNCVHQLFGPFNKSKSSVVICEGPWDGMKMAEELRRYKITKEGEFTKTKSKRDCLYADANVVSVPGCEVFRTDWIPMLKDKVVYVIYDNDHPREHPKTGKEIAPAGLSGMKRAVSTMNKDGIPSTQIRTMLWGTEGFDPELKSGYDVRDWFNNENDLNSLWERICEVPVEWLTEQDDAADDAGEDWIPLLECNSFQELEASWEEALEWTITLRDTLLCILATSASTRLQGDQIFMRVIGPPGSAKSTFCEAISTNREYVKPISVMKGLHSGWKGSGASKGKDSSLIPRINGKTVVVKDADTIISSPNVNQILSDFRDIWDGTSRSEYKNLQSKEYSNIRTTFILAGTNTLRKLNRASAGDRFLDCIIYDRETQDKAFEKRILKRSAASALKQVRSETKEEGSTQDNTNPDLMKAMQLTGGFVGWLRENVPHEICKVECPNSVLDEITCIGEMVSFLRARPDKDAEEESQEVELATRLTNQFVRLANCLAVVMGKNSVDKEVLSIVKKVANDTGKGIIRNVAYILYDEAEEGGCSVGLIAHRIGRSENMVRKYLRFMREIGMVHGKSVKTAGSGQGRGRQIWKLKTRVENLFGSIVNG